jgi:PKD repeat protein
MIPSGSNYPQELDTNQNMFHVKDALRVVLAEDYNPGDTIITVVGDETTMRLFDDTGIITLTEQCSDPALRAISFYYGKRTLTTFEELEILPQFTDSVKPKDITNVTQNVMAEHHNSLKDALIAIENFVGKKGETTTKPLTGTMEQRINYLRNLVLAPKAWFTVDQTLGLAPLTVTFQDQSFRLGTDGTSHSLTYLWDFGDNVGPSIITINEPTAVPPSTTNVLVYDTDGGSIQKTYNAGTYDVTLTVTNDFGSDTVTFPNLITARLPAPDYATIEFTPRSGQILTSGSPVDGPYTETSPKIRSVTNTLISLYIPDSINPNTGNTDAGESVEREIQAQNHGSRESALGALRASLAEENPAGSSRLRYCFHRDRSYFRFAPNETLIQNLSSKPRHSGFDI